MRVLHVIDPASPGGGACTLQLLSEPLHRLRSVEQDIVLIGTARHESLARACGVTPSGRLAAPLNQPILAGLVGDSFRRLVRTYEHSRGAYDVIHAWTARSTLLTALVAPDRPRLSTLAVGPVNGIMTQALGAALRRRPAALLATSVAVKRDYVAMGVDEEQIEVLRPAVHPEAVEASVTERDALRVRWRADEDDFVIGLLAEPTNWSDARRAVAAVTLIHASGRRARLLIHPRAERRAQAREWVCRLGLESSLILEDGLATPWTCLRGMDAALVIGDDSNTLDLRESGSPIAILVGGGRSLRPMSGVMPALWAMAAGVPVVAERSLALEEIIEDGRTGLLFAQHDVNAAAAGLVRLMESAEFAASIASGAAAHVRQNYHVSAYCVLLKEMYERVAAGRVARIIRGDADDDVVEQRNRSAAAG